MSAIASFWAQKQRIKDPVAKLLLLKLADQANDDGVCWPSKRTLAEYLGCHPSLIPRKVRFLENSGLLSRVARQRPNQSSTSNVYQLHLSHVEGIFLPNIEGIRTDTGEGIRTDTPGELRSPEPIQKEGDEQVAAVRIKFKKQERDALWDSLVEVTSITPVTLGEKSRFGKSVNEILGVGGTPAEVKSRAKIYNKKYGTAPLTDRALANRWGELSGPKSAPLAGCPTCSESMTVQALREHRYQKHSHGSPCVTCSSVVLPEEPVCLVCFARGTKAG